MSTSNMGSDEYEIFGIQKMSFCEETQKEPLKRYSAELLLREIALFSGANQRSIFVFLIIVVGGKLSLPTVARMMHGPEYMKLEWDGILYTVLEMVCQLFFLMQNYTFIAAGHLDFQRRYYMQEYVSSLINPFKFELGNKFQITPTINFCSRESIHTWFQLRCCILDFGRKYLYRIYIYSSTFLGIYLFYAAFLLLSYFNLVTIHFSFLFNVFCIYEIVIVLGVILTMLMYGAKTNQLFTNDRL